MGVSIVHCLIFEGIIFYKGQVGNGMKDLSFSIKRLVVTWYPPVYSDCLLRPGYHFINFHSGEAAAAA